jgi:hypothetical protein
MSWSRVLCLAVVACGACARGGSQAPRSVDSGAPVPIAAADGGGGSGGAVVTGAPEAGIPDLDAAADAPAGSADRPVDDAGAGDLLLDDPTTWPGGAYGKDFIVACPEGASRMACCQHYCGCMAKNCGNVASVKLPKDCMAACLSPEAVQSWDLRCRVYNCFESLNPLAQKDRVAHCEHAGARGAGDTFAKCHVAGEPAER